MHYNSTRDNYSLVPVQYTNLLSAVDRYKFKPSEWLAIHYFYFVDKPRATNLCYFNWPISQWPFFHQWRRTSWFIPTAYGRMSAKRLMRAVPIQNDSNLLHGGWIAFLFQRWPQSERYLGFVSRACVDGADSPECIRFDQCCWYDIYQQVACRHGMEPA